MKHVMVLIQFFSISDSIERCGNGVDGRIEWTSEVEAGHKPKQQAPIMRQTAEQD